MRGRAWVALWLLYFLGVLAVVVARQTSAVVAATELRTLQEERLVLESRRNELLIRIREGRSRASLIPRAEDLGLRLPVDSEIVTLEVVRPTR